MKPTMNTIVRTSIFIGLLVAGFLFVARLLWRGENPGAQPSPPSAGPKAFGPPRKLSDEQLADLRTRVDELKRRYREAVETNSVNYELVRELNDAARGTPLVTEVTRFQSEMLDESTRRSKRDAWLPRKVLPDEEVIQLLENVLTSALGKDRWDAWREVFKIRISDAVLPRVLAEYEVAKDTEMQLMLLMLAGHNGSDAASNFLLDVALRPGTSEHQRTALTSLGPRPLPEGAAARVEGIALNSTLAKDVRLAAIGLLCRHADKLSEQCIASLSADPDPGIRRDIAAGLDFEVASHVPRLLTLTGDAAADVRARAVRNVSWRADDADVRRRLMDLAVSDPDPEVRREAVRGMASPALNDDAAVKELLTRLLQTDPSEGVREEAQRTLRWLKD